MMRLSSRLSGLSESATLAVDAKVQELTRAGKDIVNLSAGQPDFDTPKHIVDAAKLALDRGATRYTPAGGTPELREAAAAWMRVTSEVPAEAKNTIISCGAKHALYNIFMAILNPGDQVLIPVPYWVTYPEQVGLAGGKSVPVKPAKGLRISSEDLDRCKTPQTRALVFNSPSNPTGEVYTSEEVEDVTQWCVANNVTMISDEIYNRLVFDGQRAVSPASFSAEAAENTVTVNGVSKTYAMTGWRIGFLTGPQDMIKTILKFQSQTTGNPAAVSQAGALAALTGDQAELDSMREAYQNRRNAAVSRLEAMEGVGLAAPQGAFYAFPAVRQAAEKAGGSVALASALVERGVAVVPGLAFGDDSRVRVSYALSDDRLQEGMNRLQTALNELT
jgi:aspartate aminotransferase